MTESGTTPPPRREATPVPGRPRRDTPHDDGRARHRPRRASADWQPVPIGTGMPRLLIEFDSVAQGIGLAPPDDDDLVAAHDDGLPKGVVRGESHTALLPKIVADAAPLPTVVVRGDERGLEAPTEPAAPAFPTTLVIPPSAAEFTDPDDFVVGGPEPADWVRLPSDPRTAPTQPSIRRRSQSESPLSPDAPTPIEPSAERRRDRTRRVVALSIGALVALLGFSSLLVTRLFSAEPESSPTIVAGPAIGAARTAITPQPVAEPQPQPVVQSQLVPPVAQVVPEPPPIAQVVPEPVAQVVPEPQSAMRQVVEVTPADLEAPTVDPVKSAPEGTATTTANARPPAPAALRPRPVRIQNGLFQPGAAPASSAAPRRVSAPSSSSQPKKRLWFPPE
jgi:hypothetical protein